MLIAILAVASNLFLVQAQPPAATSKPDATLMKANLGGSCSADFTVKDSDGKPVYGSIVHVRVRYGFMGVKHADLEIGTNSEGKARIEGLPDKAKPLAYDIKKDDKKAMAEQNLEDNCHATFEVSLK